MVGGWTDFLHSTLSISLVIPLPKNASMSLGEMDSCKAVGCFFLGGGWSYFFCLLRKRGELGGEVNKPEECWVFTGDTDSWESWRNWVFSSLKRYSGFPKYTPGFHKEIIGKLISLEENQHKVNNHNNVDIGD